MKAVDFTSPRKAILKDVDEPKPGSSDVIVKVAVCAICGSDIPLYLHTQKGWNTSIIPGHEVTGKIVEAGENVRNFDVGDRVVVYAGIPCGKCYYCRQGQTNYCSTMMDQRMIGFTLNGGYAEYLKASEKQLFKLPKEISFEDGSLLLDPIGVAVEGLKRIRVDKHSKVAVYGCGTIGIGTMLTLQVEYGLKEIFAVEISDYRRRIVEDLGIDTINPKEKNATEEIIEATGGMGVDLAIDATGNSQAEINALKTVRKLGRVLFLGENYGEISLSPSHLFIANGLTLAGSRYFPQTALKEHTEILLRAKQKFGKINTHEFTLEQVTEALELFVNKDCIRPLLKPEMA